MIPQSQNRWYYHLHSDGFCQSDTYKVVTHKAIQL